mmetsp:Transcript_23262/g.26775  ORF Transcript_23262/g.26775 Transcript_23262/m.26775 type:complete len:219 (-) Transcript_23262:394-1050(-)
MMPRIHGRPSCPLGSHIGARVHSIITNSEHYSYVFKVPCEFVAHLDGRTQRPPERPFELIHGTGVPHPGRVIVGNGGDIKVEITVFLSEDEILSERRFDVFGHLLLRDLAVSCTVEGGPVPHDDLALPERLPRQLHGRDKALSLWLIDRPIVYIFEVAAIGIGHPPSVTVVGHVLAVLVSAVGVPLAKEIPHFDDIFGQGVHELLDHVGPIGANVAPR